MFLIRNIAQPDDHHMQNMNYQNKLRYIINTSYDLLLGQVGNGRIIIKNEASMQLHFAYILKSVGDLMQFSNDDLFSITLETPYLSHNTLNKSGSRTAKIDIVLSLSNATTSSSCAIELKYFQKDNHREPNNRYDAYNDLGNLEDYVYSKQYDFGVFILATNHLHYVTQSSYSTDTADFDLRHNRSYKAGIVLEYRTKKPYGHGPITLRSDYQFAWNKADSVYFLKQYIR